MLMPIMRRQSVTRGRATEATTILQMEVESVVARVTVSLSRLLGVMITLSLVALSLKIQVP